MRKYSSKENNDSQGKSLAVQNENPFIGSYIQGKFSEDLMKQQIETMLNGGFETSGRAIAYIILMLAMHPNIQEEVFAELHSVFEKQDEETAYEHLQKLPLLDRVIKETLRLFPVAPFIERVSSAEVPISNCVLPKDTYISISFFTLHRV